MLGLLMSLSASLAYFQHSNKYATEAERRLKLFPAVSLFCFSFISKCDDATGWHVLFLSYSSSCPAWCCRPGHQSTVETNAAPIHGGSCMPISDVASRRHLHSARHHYLVVPRYSLSSHGRRAFAVASPTAWNSLSDDLRDPTLSTDNFRPSA